MNYELLERDLIRDEGWRSNPYLCTSGKITIGVGHRMLAHELHLKEVDSDWIWSTLRQDALLAVRGCEMIFGRTKFYTFSPVRQRALVNMAFQLGTEGLSKFQRMIQAIFKDDWAQAQIEALDSKWAKQTPTRARRVAEMIRTGMDRKDVKA